MKLSIAFVALLHFAEADSRQLRMRGNKKAKGETEEIEIEMKPGFCQNFVPNPMKGVDQVRFHSLYSKKCH